MLVDIQTPSFLQRRPLHLDPEVVHQAPAMPAVSYQQPSYPPTHNFRRPSPPTQLPTPSTSRTAPVTVGTRHSAPTRGHSVILPQTTKQSCN